MSKWSKRFQHDGPEGLKDKAGRGRKPSVPMETVEQIIVKVTQPPPGRTRWSLRSMAKAAGVSRHAVYTIWKRNDLKPHRTRTFKLSKDPQFEQPGLPLGVGHIRTQTHDYIRHGTITLFAALNYLEWKIISRTEAKHIHAGVVALSQTNRSRDPQGPGNPHDRGQLRHSQTRQRPRVDAASPAFSHAFYAHETSSWLNLVERFFADLTRNVVREGSFRSVRHLVQDIESYLADRNEHPKPYKWKAAGSDILAKIHRARAAMTAQP